MSIHYSVKLVPKDAPLASNLGVQNKKVMLPQEECGYAHSNGHAPLPHLFVYTHSFWPPHNYLLMKAYHVYHATMKIAKASPAKLIDRHLEEVVDIRNRKSRRIAV